jgi:hypothetical protein
LKGRDYMDGLRRMMESITETECEGVKYCLYGMKDEWLSAKILDISRRRRNVGRTRTRCMDQKLSWTLTGLKTQVLQKKKKIWGRKLHSSRLTPGQTAGFCAQGSETSRYEKGEEYVDQLWLSIPRKAIYIKP